MRIYKYLFFLGLLAFASCISGDKVPGDVIGEEEMPAILVDLHIVDGDLYNVSQTPDSLYKFGMGHYVAVFNKYHTDSTQFKRSFTWYTKHPVMLDKIYDDVVKVLQAKNDSISKIKVPAAKVVSPASASVKKDSIPKPDKIQIVEPGKAAPQQTAPVQPQVTPPVAPKTLKKANGPVKRNLVPGKTPFKKADAVSIK